MGIKVNSKPAKVKDYPKLMISNTSGNIGLVEDRDGNIVVLFVTPGNAAQVGRYKSQDLSGWREYNEPLTLQNE